MDAPRNFPSSGHCIADAKPRETFTPLVKQRESYKRRDGQWP